MATANGSNPFSNPVETPVVNVKEVAKQAGIPDKHLPGFERMVQNVLMMRSEIMKRLIDPRREITDECGYPTNVNIEDYRSLYNWEPVAARVVEVMPKESWQVQPRVYEDEDGNVETTWESRYKEMLQSLKGERVHFEDDQGSILWEYFKQADIECGIGYFSVILLGLDDGGELKDPVIPRDGMKLVYLRVFGEPQVQIKSMETNLFDPRFGQPTEYTLTFNDPAQYNATSVATKTQDVHWTRIVHISEGDVRGIPRMQQVYRRLLDLVKLYGGSAEMYWRGAFPGISLETDPKLGGDVPVNIEATKDMMEAYMNGLQRYLALNGFIAKSLAPQVVDPSPQIRVQIEAICIKIGIPLRIFMGSERGELASSQDDASWNDRLRERFNSFNTPKIIVPFLSRLIFLGVLPTPVDSLHVVWPDLDSQTANDKATIALKNTQAITTYVGGSGESLMTPFDFLTSILGFSDEDAEGIVDRAMEAIEQQETEEGTQTADPQHQGNDSDDDEQTDTEKQDLIDGGDE